MPNKQPPIVEERLTWPEIEAFFLKRLLLRPEVYYALGEEYRSCAFTIKRFITMSILKKSKEKLQEILEAGGRLKDFQKWAKIEGIKWEKNYSELVYRMAMRSSLSKGIHDMINDPDLFEDFPYIRYVFVDDSRCRQSHRDMGGVYRREDFPESFYPLNGYNCRCWVTAIHKRMLGNRLLKTPPNVEPDEGFGKNQNANLYDSLNEELERRTL